MPAGSEEATRDISLAEVLAAAERIAGRVARTPLLSSRSAARLVAEGSGATPRLLLKAEHLQVTGSFKPRGATNRILQLTAEERGAGLITLSAGNHAQAVAYAAASAGVAVTVVMPAGASRAKAAAAAAYGAEVILHGEHVGDTFARMEELRDQRGLVFIHPFDDPAIIAGQGTVGLEILADLPEVDVIVVGVGGGGLISGVAAAARQLKPGVRIVGVEPQLSDALSRGVAAGEPVTLQPVSIADGLGAPFAGRWTIDLARRYVERIVLVDEATIAGGMRFALERMKQLLEPAGATALGAVLAGHVPLGDGETVCVVASGGNVDVERLPELLAMATEEESLR
ncbi:MAG: pyridoxal-phosphate dependent enzyme [Chloroflexota bacterium]|nr:pyridoxal-phosphate dependent enzyme [Chloroflexota bacterium]